MDELLETAYGLCKAAAATNGSSAANTMGIFAMLQHVCEKMKAANRDIARKVDGLSQAEASVSEERSCLAGPMMAIEGLDHTIEGNIRQLQAIQDSIVQHGQMLTRTDQSDTQALGTAMSDIETLRAALTSLPSKTWIDERFNDTRGSITTTIEYISQAQETATANVAGLETAVQTLPTQPWFEQHVGDRLLGELNTTLANVGETSSNGLSSGQDKDGDVSDGVKELPAAIWEGKASKKLVRHFGRQLEAIRDGMAGFSGIEGNINALSQGLRAAPSRTFLKRSLDDVVDRVASQQIEPPSIDEIEEVLSLLLEHAPSCDFLKNTVQGAADGIAGKLVELFRRVDDEMKQGLSQWLENAPSLSFMKRSLDDVVDRVASQLVDPPSIDAIETSLSRLIAQDPSGDLLKRSIEDAALVVTEKLDERPSREEMNSIVSSRLQGILSKDYFKSKVKEALNELVLRLEDIKAAVDKCSIRESMESLWNETQAAAASSKDTEIARLQERLRAAESTVADKDRQIDELTQRCDELDQQLRMAAIRDAANEAANRRVEGTFQARLDQLISVQAETVREERLSATLEVRLQGKQQELEHALARSAQFEAEGEDLTDQCRDLEQDLCRQKEEADRAIGALRAEIRGHHQSAVSGPTTPATPNDGNLGAAATTASTTTAIVPQTSSLSSVSGGSSRRKRVRRHHSSSETGSPETGSQELADGYKALASKAAGIALALPAEATFDLDQLSLDLVCIISAGDRVRHIITYLQHAPPGQWCCVNSVCLGYQYIPIDPRRPCSIHNTTCLVMFVISVGSQRRLNFSRCLNS